MRIILASISLLFFLSCDKSAFLDEKPRSAMLIPSTLEDFQLLLNNQLMPNVFGLVSSDDVYFSEVNLNTVRGFIRNSYLWEKDQYAGEADMREWRDAYQAIFIANNVIESIGIIEGDSRVKNDILGQAYFKRAFSYFDLATHFCEIYKKNETEQLGVPLKIKSDINEVVARASLKETFELIVSDLNRAKDLLSVSQPIADLYRPNKQALFALLAKVHLYQGEYSLSNQYADSCLAMSHTLLDYNQLDPSISKPFGDRNAEVLFNAIGTIYTEINGRVGNPARINPDLIALYEENDLRRDLFFSKDPSSGLSFMRYTYGVFSVWPFLGLSIDEVYLTKIESAIRESKLENAKLFFEKFVNFRYHEHPYDVDKLVSDPDLFLKSVLLERRKQLVWRNSRWLDIKRLNRDGLAIHLSRSVGTQTIELPPNDKRYALAIPQEEIDRSKIIQNER